MNIMLLILILVLVAGLVVISIYNTLVRTKNQVKNAWAQIDVQLKRRHDLIPNLLETVKGYMSHERITLEKITELRQQAINIRGEAVETISQIENQLSGALKSLFALSENYPDLKASQNFLQFQEELASTENKISFARQFYNDSVMNYNNQTQTFPANIVAGMFNFTAETFFEVPEEEKEVPQVKF